MIYDSTREPEMKLFRKVIVGIGVHVRDPNRLHNHVA